MMRKNKPFIMGMAVVLALVTVFSAVTFAWFSANDSVTNHLETAKLTDGDVTILEVWDPEDGKDWTPDQTVNKDVGAINTGTGSALVRISFEEVLTKLTTGVPESKATGYTASATYIPQLIETSAYSAWTTFGAAADPFTLKAALPSDVTLKYKATTVPDGAGTKTTYNFVAWYEIPAAVAAPYGGKAQKAIATFSFDNATSVLTCTDWKYMGYTMGAKAEKAWATFASPKTTGTATLHTAADFTGSPFKTWAVSDSTNKYIELIFSSAVKTDITATSEGDWWYNAEDGFFYYIGKLSSGATTANNLLDALYLSKDATSSYSSMSFDVIVNLEAVQNLEAAVTSASGWGMTAGTETTALIAKLTAVGAFA